MTNFPQLLPEDEFNAALEQDVHPPDYKNPLPSGRYNLVVIGAGTAGLVAAAGAAGMGAKVALVERQLMGGTKLWNTTANQGTWSSWNLIDQRQTACFDS